MPEPPIPSKGDRVVLRKSCKKYKEAVREVGPTTHEPQPLGVCFWIGPDKFRPGQMRYGIKLAWYDSPLFVGADDILSVEVKRPPDAAGRKGLKDVPELGHLPKQLRESLERERHEAQRINDELKKRKEEALRRTTATKAAIVEAAARVDAARTESERLQAASERAASLFTAMRGSEFIPLEEPPKIVKKRAQIEVEESELEL